MADRSHVFHIFLTLMFRFLLTSLCSSVLQDLRPDLISQSAESLIQRLRDGSKMNMKSTEYFGEIGMDLKNSQILYESFLEATESEIVMMKPIKMLNNFRLFQKASGLARKTPWLANPCHVQINASRGHGFIPILPLDCYYRNKTFSEHFCSLCQAIAKINTELKEEIRNFHILYGPAISRLMAIMQVSYNDKIDIQVKNDVIIIEVSSEKRNPPLSINYTNLCTANLKMFIKSIEAIQTYSFLMVKYIDSIISNRFIVHKNVFTAEAYDLICIHGVIETLNRANQSLIANSKAIKLLEILYGQLKKCYNLHNDTRTDIDQ